MSSRSTEATRARIRPVRIRISQLVPTLTSGIEQHEDLWSAAVLTDAELKAGVGWRPEVEWCDLEVIRVPHLDYWIRGSRAQTASTIGRFSPPDDRGRTELHLIPPPIGTADGEGRFGRALGYLYLAVRPGATHSFTRSLVGLATELAAAAHLAAPESRVTTIDRAAERELRHTDAMTRSIPGGAPGLGKRA